MALSTRTGFVPRLLLLAGLVAQPGAPAFGQPPAPASKPAAPARVPFELLPTNHMVVSAKLNGKGPYRLIFDLGAPITLISNRAAEGAGVVEKKAPRSLLFAMRGEAQVNELKVGDLEAKKLPVIVLDHPAIRVLSSFGRPIDGIIGYTFFARYRTTIDYQKREMTLAPVDFEVRNLMRDLPDRLMGAKVERTRVLAPGALLGLTVEKAADKGDAQTAGVSIKAVLPNSPAAEAGLQPGDLLTALDGRWTTSVADTYHAAASLTPGKPVEAVVYRGGKPTTLTLTPRDGF